MSLTLLSFKGDPKVLAALIAAEYVQTSIETPDFDAAAEVKKDDFHKKSPFGKLPILETPEGSLFEPEAILRYVSGLNGAANLLGSSYFEKSQVDQWLSFAYNQLAPVANQWVYPILEALPFNKGAIEKAKGDLKALLKVVDCHLQCRTYLVGQAVSAADIAVATSLLLAFKLVLDSATQKSHVNLTRWFTTVVHQPEFAAVLGKVELCTVAKEPQPPKKEAAPKADKPKAEKPAAAPAPAAAGNDDEDEDESHADAKPKGPHWSDSLPKSKMVMDEWKRCYSNEDTKTVANPRFWEMFDHEGYSLWECQYKYNNELTKVFMTCNLVSGWFQRLDRVRKYAFGNVHIFGSEGNMVIRGMWMFRGQELPPEFLESDDSELYTFRKLSFPVSAADKQLVEDFWLWEGSFGGEKLPFNQGKTFK